MSYAIEMENLTRYYGLKPGIININASIEKGRLVGLLGPNGSGKTTTIRILSGYMPPSEGQSRICGYDTFSHPMQTRSMVGYLPENNPLYTDMRVSEYLVWMGQLKGLSGSALNRAMHRAMESCDLLHESTARINTLSKGYRQRIGLASILLSNPEVLILDEPTIGLDPLQVRQFRTLLESLKEQHTILFSSHILSEIQMICDSMLILNEGCLIASGTLNEICADANQSYRLVCKLHDALPKVLPSLLKGLPDVQLDHLWEADNTMHIRLLAKKSDLREELIKVFAQTEFTILEIYREPLSLEDVFIERISNPTESLEENRIS